MSRAHILVKNNNIQHCYSIAIKDKMVNNGWKYVAVVDGWNMSFTYLGKHLPI